jgi:hypothetical protein
MSDTTTPADAGIELTAKGERYAAEHGNDTYFAEIGKLRRIASREIARLIDFLDRLDGDWDLEDDGSAEPTLGWPERPGFGALSLRPGPQEDGESEWSIGSKGDLELDKADDEPSLGSSACFGFFGYGYWRGYDASPEWNQEHWAAGRCDDIENDPADPPERVGLGEGEGYEHN